MGSSADTCRPCGSGRSGLSPGREVGKVQNASASKAVLNLRGSELASCAMMGQEEMQDEKNLLASFFLSYP